MIHLKKAALWMLSIIGVAHMAVCAHAQQDSAQTEDPAVFAKVTSASALPNGIEVRDGSLILQITALRGCASAPRLKNRHLT
jgi:hypothetical protein